MSYILNIDTATETAHVSLAKDGQVLHAIENTNQKDHAAFLQPAANALVKKTAITFNELDAIAVTAGPGSYTGLRVGMASAKGLCYALNKPLITLNTLQVMAQAVITQQNNPSAYYCPMIDARRLEVFTAMYNFNLQALIQPCALILEQTSFEIFLQSNEVVFFGSGAKKWQAMIKNTSAIFQYNYLTVNALAMLAYKNLTQNNFSNLAYSEPIYLKDFFQN
jgi:tRNA threonylcarbamoyladenosine biosynthesis protein TsaB